MTQPSPPIEHFLILGPKNFPSELKYETFSKNSFEVGLIDSFPKFDILPEYLEHINLWCFPDGYQVLDSYHNIINNGDIVKSRTGKPANKIWDEMANYSKINHFILTDSEYNKRYCSALLFYEKYDLIDAYPGFNQSKISAIDKNIVFCPKVLCIISQVSILGIHEQILTFFFENLLKPKHFQYMPIKSSAIGISKALFNHYQEYQKLHGKERGEALFFDKFNELNEAKTQEIMIFETDYIEFYMSFFYYCLPTYSPPEDYSVVVEGLNKEKGLLLKYNISKDQNLYENQFRTLFTKMQLPNILKLVKFCLLEKSIIIFSKKPNDAIAVTETLLSLINPLKWTCIYAPLLPISMVQILQAVIPYIVGMNSKHKETVLTSMDLSDKVVVDLDEDTIIYSQDTIFLPRASVERITRKMTKIIKKIHNNNSNLIEKDLVEATFQIKAAFSDFMLGIINNYVPFFLFSRDFNDKTVVSSEIFDQSSYTKVFPQEDRPFIQDFTSKTMMFNKFLEDSYKILYFLDFIKKDLVPLGLEDTSYFISGLKKILKNLNKGTINGQFEGYIDLESLKHLQRLIDLDTDLRLHLAMDNYIKPKKIKVLQYFIKYYQSVFEPEPMKHEGFLLLKCFNPNKIIRLIDNNMKSMNQINVTREKPIIEDDLMEFTSINLPMKQTIFAAKSSDNTENEEKKGLIEAILLKEMENCMVEKKKPRRKTIFEECELRPSKIMENLDFDDIFKEKQKTPPPLGLKKALSEQPNVRISGFNVNNDINKMNISSFQVKNHENTYNINKTILDCRENINNNRENVINISENVNNNRENINDNRENINNNRENINKISKSQINSNTKIGFEMYANKKAQMPRKNEEVARKVPIMNVTNGEEKGGNPENQEFSIFSYLISDMLKEDEKLAFFPVKQKTSHRENPHLQLKRQMTTGNYEHKETFDYSFNEKTSEKSDKIGETVNRTQDFNKLVNIQDTVKQGKMKKNDDLKLKTQKSYESKENSKNLKVPEHSIIKSQNLCKTPQAKKSEELVKTRELMGNVGKPLEKILNSQRKEGYLENAFNKYQATTPIKANIMNRNENEKMIFGKAKGEDKEKKALKEMTNMTLNVDMDANSYDYNSRLLKKKSFMNN